MNKIQSYEIIEKIGIGGMGTVYKARHEFRDGFFAIKSLHPQFAENELIKQRFKEEAKILNKLKHENVVKVEDFIDDSTGLHIVMEFVEGKTLDRTGQITYLFCLPLFKQILEGIEHAHEKGIVHRDIKPANIIVTPNSKIKIADFGIARIVEADTHTKTGIRMGTLLFMSPEQVKSSKVGKLSDIYSLGVTLYVMLTGKHPYNEQMSEFTLGNKIVNEEFPDPRITHPHIPEWLVNIVFKAMAKKKEDRIQSIAEFKKLIMEGENQKADMFSGTKGIPAPVDISNYPTEIGIPQPEDPQRFIDTEINIPKPEDNEKSKFTKIELNEPKAKVNETKPNVKSKKIKYLQAFSLGVILLAVLFVPFRLIYEAYEANKKAEIEAIPYTPKGVIIPLEWISVEGGTFNMGSNDYGHEKPIHRVTVSSFKISKTEVTVAQYFSYCKATGTNMPSKLSWGWNDADPIVNVSWDDAQGYCKWAKVRLPTEAEWEYAARGGNMSKGYKYSGSDNLDNVAWNYNNSNSKVHQVGTKQPNELGLYDMSGNVWEWCSDYYNENYYKSSPEINPKGPVSGSYRVLRGGSWGYGDDNYRAALRYWHYPGSRDDNFGFRVVQD